MILATISLYAHQILELAAYAAGFQLYLFLRRRWPRGPGLNAEQTAWIVIGVIFGALVGAKLLAWAESAPVYWQHRGDWRILIGGKTIVGAILGGWVGVELVKRRLGLSHPSGDIYVFPVILGMCIGRVGCFFGGLDDHTYGIATSVPWGVDFGDGIRRHPTQLYEVVFLMATAGVLAWRQVHDRIGGIPSNGFGGAGMPRQTRMSVLQPFDDRQECLSHQNLAGAPPKVSWTPWRLRSGRQRGCMFSQFVFAYMGWRLLVEFIKPRYTMPVVPLSAIQLASLGGMVYAIFHWNDNCCGRLAEATERRSDGATEGECAADARECGGECGRAAGDGIRAAEGGDRVPVCVELTNSLCPHCLAKVEAKIMVDARRVFLQRFCPEHGQQRVLIADDAGYWQRCRDLYTSAPTAPGRRQSEMRRGCPWDCGLCADHEQHTCLAIVEITDQCDLGCPVCYASSAAGGRHRSVAEVEAMLDAVVAGQRQDSGSGVSTLDAEAQSRDGSATMVGVVQISGGEPTLHPDLFAILDATRRRPIRHVMLNTNGRRIAEDDEFVGRLGTYRPGFEVYLQFDSLRPGTLRQLRGQDLSDSRRRAIAALNRHNISTTLVVTLKKGVNDQEIGEILDFAIAQPCVRGVTFQPIQAAGRLNGFDPAVHRLTLTEVRRAIIEQHKLFTREDIVPVPCHPDALAMGYALRHGGGVVPLSKLLDPQALLKVAGNTICFEQDPKLRQHVRELFTASASAMSVAQKLGLQCCLPLLPRNGSPINYENVFRVIIMQFMDAWSMDLRSVKRSCVHIVAADGRLMPFETYNLLHRPGCRMSSETAHAVE
ncbi:MAG: prolipoprotein diacylglyceryl transferase family protein [Tepidisphaerales bacterium]